MAVTIELWVDGRLVDGAEQWWDDVESALEPLAADLPLLDAVRPYGELTLRAASIRDLHEEIRILQSTGPERIRSFLNKLASLCEAGEQAADGELRFVGD